MQIKIELVDVLYFQQESSQTDEFIQEIRDYSASVSGQPVPVGVMMFGVCSYMLH